MNDYFKNPLYRQAFFEDTDRIMAGFQNDFKLLKSGPFSRDILKKAHRYAHSLKGLTAMMELHDARQIAAGLESLTGRMLKNNLAGLDENSRREIQNGFDKIGEMMRHLKNTVAGRPPDEA